MELREIEHLVEAESLVHAMPRSICPEQDARIEARMSKYMELAASTASPRARAFATRMITVLSRKLSYAS